MESLERYKKKVGISRPKAASNPFIEMALNKITIHKYVSGETSDEEFEAVLIFRDREGPDNGILYTYQKDGLDIGDVIVKEGSTKEQNAYYLILEEVKRVDGSEVIRVFNALETNVLFTTKTSSEKLPGYLLSNLKNIIKSNTREGMTLESKKAVLVAPKSYKVRLDEKMNMENLITGEESYASWLVEGIDDISTPHINYMHLSQILKDNFEPDVPREDLEDEEGDPIEAEVVDALTSITLATSGGYIKTVPQTTIMDRKANRVIVLVPEITGLFEVHVKDSSGEIIIHKYNVRG